MSILSIFTAPTIQEIITQEIADCGEQIRDSQAVIEAHQFQKHMAERKLAALEAWINKEAGPK